MAEDFPDDSFFRNSNVALLDAAFVKNDKCRTPVARGDSLVGTLKTSTCTEGDPSVLKFTTAKDLLDSLKKEDNDRSGCSNAKNSKGEKQDPKYSKKVCDSQETKGAFEEKKIVPKSKAEELRKALKSKIEIKDRIKNGNGYRPLNITKCVSSSIKLPENGSQVFLQESDDKEILESSSLAGRPDDNSNIITSQQKLQLDAWGLPHNILHQYSKRGITQMFPWQVECLCSPRVLIGGNLVYSAPTSAGKTLVAEILCIKTVLEKRKKALFILPFISVVREKMYYFQELLRGSGICVDGFMGGHSPPGGFRTVDLAVCTIEKANSLINRLMEEESLSDLGAVIVDELHLIGDPHRGYLLELLLTKLKFMSSRGHNICIQVVGMSATLPNLALLSTWLDADLYKTTFRPIPLEEFVKIGSVVYNKTMQPVRTIKPEFEIKNDTENIVYLCVETIADGHSVLIFCPTKSWCESLAQTIAAEFKSIGLDRDLNAPESLPYKLRDQLNASAIAQALEQLKRCPVGLDNIMKKVVSFGVAFHHAGLTMDERDIVEGCFRNGTLRVLVATSTLSSGVNLPARRVIIRTPIFHSRPVNILAYQQMVGRAGRMGVDSAGESFLICQTVEKRIAENLLRANLTPIQSCLGLGNLSTSLKRAILEVIASKVATTPKDVQLYANCTLLAASLKEGGSVPKSHVFESSDGDDPISSCVEFLHQNEFIRLQVGEDGTTQYIPSPLGQACLSASLSPDEGLLLFKELDRARQCFVLENELHIIYQVTPFNIAEQWGNLDWLQVLALWEQLSADLKRVGELVGVEDRFIVRAMRGTINANSEKQRMKIMIHRRFYAALALHDLVNEVPLNTVARKFNCSRGVLQSLQQSASTYAGMVTSFCHRLGWSTLELLIDQFQDRLHFGTHRDLLDLLKLPALNGPRARALYNVGITTLMELTTADVLKVENALQSAVPFASDKERDGETTFETEHRRKLKGIWITGRHGLTEREAAELIIEEARTIIQVELGVKGIIWEKAKSPEKSMEAISKNCAEISISNSEKLNHQIQEGQLQSEELASNNKNACLATNFTGIEINEMKMPQFKNLGCMDMSKKLSSKVERIIESLQKKEILKRNAIESCKDLNAINGNTHRSDNTMSEAECGKAEEETCKSVMRELSCTNPSVFDLSTQCMLNTNCESSPHVTLREADVLEDDIDILEIGQNEADENYKKCQRESEEMLFESSISNTAMAELAYSNLDESCSHSDKAHCSSSDLNNGHLGSLCISNSNQYRPSNLENQLEISYDSSSSSNNSNNKKRKESDVLDDIFFDGEVPQSGGVGGSCCTPQRVDESTKRRLSVDLFIVSPSQDEIAAVGMSAVTLNKETPVSGRAQECGSIGSRKTPTGGISNQSRGLFASPLLGSSPDILINDRSPSLFGDSFEVDCSVLDVGGGSKIDSIESCERVIDIVQVQEQTNKTQVSLESVSSTSVNSDLHVNVDDIESQTSEQSKSSSISIKRCLKSCTSFTETSELGSENSVSSKEPFRYLRERSSQKGNSLHLGLRRRPLKRKSSKEISNSEVNNEVITDSFLGAAFKSAFDFNDSVPLLEKGSNSVRADDHQSDGIANQVPVAVTLKSINALSRSFSAQFGEHLKDTPSKKLKLGTSSDSQIFEDVVLSSQESIPNRAKKIRKSSRAKINSKHKLTAMVKDEEITSRKVPSKEINIIGPPQSRTVLLYRQETLKAYDEMQAVSAGKPLPHSVSCSSKTVDACNPFEVNTSVDWSSFNIIDVCGNTDLFNSFVQTVGAIKTLSMSLACEKRAQGSKSHIEIGSRIIKKLKHCAQDPIVQDETHQLIFENLCLVGVSFSFGGTDAYYVNLKIDAEEQCVILEDRLKLLKGIVGCGKNIPTRTVCCFDWKEQFKVLHRCTGIEIGCIIPCDPKVADWLLEPEGKQKNLQALIVAYLTEATGVAQQVGNVRSGNGSPALDVEQTIPARQRASLEAILSWNLLRVQHKVLTETGLLHSFTEVEMPVLMSVARMELNGVAFDSVTAEALRDQLVSKLEELQEQCYELAGRPFSLTSPVDTAQVLYQELKLKPDYTKNGGGKSTSKEALLRLCHRHPLPAVILLWRKINAILVKTFSPLLYPGISEGGDRIFGQYIFHTATGRLLMHEPNLQNIPRNFSISPDATQNFSMRAAFVPAEGYMFVAADYSQLELRLLAHLSNDTVLKDVLNSDKDVFCCIAASWNNISEEEVTDQLRQRAKQTCYGILYGMGISALAEQLEVDESEASILIEKFCSTYPGVRQYVNETIAFCKENGYVQTLLGRRRQLPAISSKNAHVRAHAERQAVNTTVQGSAADIAKSAMISIEKALHKCGETESSAPRLVLHLHDELIYEVPEGLVSQFTILLQNKMENALSLTVKLPVKVKKGRSWGALENVE